MDRDELRDKYMSKLSAEEMTEAMGMTDSPFVSTLSVLFADVVSFYFRAHGAHWNVVGPDFTEWHTFFGEIAYDVYGSFDPMAENIRKVGGFPPARLMQLVAMRTLGDGMDSTDGSALARDLHDSNDSLISSLKTAFVVADAENEQGVANFIAERIDMHQKWAWQLRSHLGML